MNQRPVTIVNGIATTATSTKIYNGSLDCALQASFLYLLADSHLTNE